MDQGHFPHPCLPAQDPFPSQTAFHERYLRKLQMFLGSSNRFHNQIRLRIISAGTESILRLALALIHLNPFPRQSFLHENPSPFNSFRYFIFFIRGNLGKPCCSIQVVRFCHEGSTIQANLRISNVACFLQKIIILPPDCVMPPLNFGLCWNPRWEIPKPHFLLPKVRQVDGVGQSCPTP
jgi:hypothetical protein